MLVLGPLTPLPFFGRSGLKGLTGEGAFCNRSKTVSFSFLSIFFFLSFCSMYQGFFLCLSLSLLLSLSISIHLFLFVSVSLSISIYSYLFVFVSLSLSIPIYLFPSFSQTHTLYHYVTCFSPGG